MRAQLSRAVCLAGVLVVVGLLPWLSGKDPALSLLRARSAEQEPTPEALAAIRADLGLDAGPLGLLGQWAAGLLRGDLGISWVSGADVLPSVVTGLQVSLTLMGAALAVALLVAAALVAPVLIRGRGTSGAFAAVLTAVPEFLLSTVLLIVAGVGLGWLPTSGWAGPAHLVLPALALGLPAGGLLGRLVAEALPGVLDERWAHLWRGAGVGRARVAAAALRRVLPPLAGQFGMVVVGLTGGAVAVEAVFAVPGLGRTTLGAVKSQDVPLVQGSLLALLVLGLLAGAAAAALRRRLLGPALRETGLSLPAPRPVRVPAWAPAVIGAVLVGVIGWGLLRDPYTVDTAARLAAPSGAHPLGADALGRDALARLGHGAAATVGMAAAVCLLGLVTALALGFLPNLATGAADIANALPPVIVGVLVAAVLGPRADGAALAVALVSWPALTAHAGGMGLAVPPRPEGDRREPGLDPDPARPALGGRPGRPARRAAPARHRTRPGVARLPRARRPAAVPRMGAAPRRVGRLRGTRSGRGTRPGRRPGPARRARRHPVRVHRTTARRTAALAKEDDFRCRLTTFSRYEICASPSAASKPSAVSPSTWGPVKSSPSSASPGPASR